MKNGKKSNSTPRLITANKKFYLYRAKAELPFDCSTIELHPSGITIVELGKRRPILTIGDWGNPPHHALPRRPSCQKAVNTTVSKWQPDGKQRFCECGIPLEFRQRYCDKCKVRRRRESNRKAQRKHNKKKRSNISN